MKYRFLIVDDHPLFRGALKLALTSPTNNVEILEAAILKPQRHLSKPIPISIFCCLTFR